MRSMNFTKYDSENMWPSLKTQHVPVGSDKNSTRIAKICIFMSWRAASKKIWHFLGKYLWGPKDYTLKISMERTSHGLRKVIFLSKWATCRFHCVSTISGHCSCLNHLTLVLQLGVVLKWLYVHQPQLKTWNKQGNLLAKMGSDYYRTWDPIEMQV